MDPNRSDTSLQFTCLLWTKQAWRKRTTGPGMKKMKTKLIIYFLLFAFKDDREWLMFTWSVVINIIHYKQLLGIIDTRLICVYGYDSRKSAWHALEWWQRHTMLARHPRPPSWGPPPPAANTHTHTHTARPLLCTRLLWRMQRFYDIF